MMNGSTRFHQKSFKIEQDDKFFSRLLSKETSNANPSFRVYYGDVSSSVPFMWESQPGTPKHNFSDTSLPPLTPPPSYYCNSNNKPRKSHNYSGSKLLRSLLRRVSLKKDGRVSASSPVSSMSSLSTLSWSSSSHSSLSNCSVTLTPSYGGRRRGNFSWGSSVDERVVDDYQREVLKRSSTSRLCFGISGRNKDSSGGINYPTVIVKKAFLSIVGRGGSH